MVRNKGYAEEENFIRIARIRRVITRGCVYENYSRQRHRGIKGFGAIIGVFAYRKNAASNGLGSISESSANKGTGMQARNNQRFNYHLDY